MEKIIIDKEKIKEELIEKNLFSLQKDLIKQRDNNFDEKQIDGFVSRVVAA